MAASCSSSGSISRAKAPRRWRTAYVDLGHWPEMLYNVKSRVDFPTEKQIFFKT